VTTHKTLLSGSTQKKNPNPVYQLENGKTVTTWSKERRFHGTRGRGVDATFPRKRTTLVQTQSQREEKLTLKQPEGGKKIKVTAWISKARGQNARQKLALKKATELRTGKNPPFIQTKGREVDQIDVETGV